VAIGFLRAIASRDYAAAATQLDDDCAREGIGDINGALSEVGRALLDYVEFGAGTVDVRDTVYTLAERALELAGATHCRDLDLLAALIVYLGSEGLPCAARSMVASLSPLDRRDALVTLVTGLAAHLARTRNESFGDLVDGLEPPAAPAPAFGTFGLAWRGDDGSPAPLSGAIPPGYTARITFLGEGRCTLRSVFARVAYLREPRNGATEPRQRLNAFAAAA
jgi:hypothetical protein